MKKVSLAVSVTLLCCVAAFGQTAGNTASGNFQFATEDGTQTVEFSARTDSGRASGGILYRGPMDTPVHDVDGTGQRTGGKYADWYLKVDVDCMVVVSNRASLSGLVIDGTQREMIGQRMILAVEDNDAKAPDRFSWGVYRNERISWIPADAELKYDEGWGLSWYASDFERRDDVPVLISRDTNPDCTTFPLGSYTLDEIARENGGDIIVR